MMLEVQVDADRQFWRARHIWPKKANMVNLGSGNDLCSAPNRNVIQLWLSVYWNLKIKIQWHLNENTTFFRERPFENIEFKLSAILFRVDIGTPWTKQLWIIQLTAIRE